MSSQKLLSHAVGRDRLRGKREGKLGRWNITAVQDNCEEM